MDALTCEPGGVLTVGSECALDAGDACPAGTYGVTLSAGKLCVACPPGEAASQPDRQPDRQTASQPASSWLCICRTAAVLHDVHRLSSILQARCAISTARLCLARGLVCRLLCCLSKHRPVVHRSRCWQLCWCSGKQRPDELLGRQLRRLRRAGRMPAVRCRDVCWLLRGDLLLHLVRRCAGLRAQPAATLVLNGGQRGQEPAAAAAPIGTAWQAPNISLAVLPLPPLRSPADSYARLPGATGCLRCVEGIPKCVAGTDPGGSCDPGLSDKPSPGYQVLSLSAPGSLSAASCGLAAASLPFAQPPLFGQCTLSAGSPTSLSLLVDRYCGVQIVPLGDAACAEPAAPYWASMKLQAAYATTNRIANQLSGSRCGGRQGGGVGLCMQRVMLFEALFCILHAALCLPACLHIRRIQLWYVRHAHTLVAARSCLSWRQCRAPRWRCPTGRPPPMWQRPQRSRPLTRWAGHQPWRPRCWKCCLLPHTAAAAAASACSTFRRSAVISVVSHYLANGTAGSLVFSASGLLCISSDTTCCADHVCVQVCTGTASVTGGQAVGLPISPSSSCPAGSYDDSDVVDGCRPWCAGHGLAKRCLLCVVQRQCRMHGSGQQPEAKCRVASAAR